MIKRSACAVLLCLCLTWCLPGYARAAQAQASLAAAVAYGGEPVPGMELTLCRAADLNGARYTATPAFAQAGADFDAMTTASSIALAAALDAYAAAKKIQRITITTDAQGKAAFTDLTPGLYLLAQANAEDAAYIAAPSLVPVKSGQDVIIYPKTERRPTGNTIDVSVYKVWAGAEDHPPSVQAQLYRDGAAYGDPVTLNAANHWRHSWTNLPRALTWTVDEVRVPEGYAKSVSGSAGAGFVILNTRIPAYAQPVTRRVKSPTSPKTTAKSSAPKTRPGAPPKTDDESTPALWLALMGLSFCALCAALVVLRKDNLQ